MTQVAADTAADRSVVERLNRERLRSIAIEAAEQCGRLTVPTIALPGTLDAVLERREVNGPLYVADEERRGVPLAEALTKQGPGDLLIGPEGGFTPEEREGLGARDDIALVSLRVSGRVQPTLDVDRRTYRVRLLNGSNARFYKLAWHDGSPMVMIEKSAGCEVSQCASMAANFIGWFSYIYWPIV